jgi:hypothetical protein
MTTINLDNLQGLPNEFLNELQGLEFIFQENRFLENLLNNNSVSSLMTRINDYCLANQIFGYHYTRAVPEDIFKTGLTCRKGDDIRNSFMTKFGHHFNKIEKIRIQKAWNNHFNFQQQKSRDNRLFFNFTTCALEDFGAEPLLTNFGGEQVYMPLQELTDIENKIRNIGTPLILKCKLDPNNINTFCEFPWGRIAVSTYHCQINHQAHQYDQDGYQNVNVKPEDIELILYEEKKHYR